MPRMNPAPPRKPTRAELERAAALNEYREELVAMMPQHFGPKFVCKACGLLVADRQAHLNSMHGEGKFLAMLKELFGDD